MNLRFFLWIYLHCAAICIFAQSKPAWHLQSVHVPQDIPLVEGQAPVVVAIVDDGLLKTHEKIRPYLWQNPEDIPFNSQDDDGNGYIDDAVGWDVADGDSDTTPPRERLAEFYHGTHLAGILTEMAEMALGENAHRYFKILPVKTISDYAQRTYLKSGFEGIEYAASMGADIILCAWSVGQMKPNEARVVQLAANRGCIIVASAGNFPENKEVFPAAHPSVLAVAGLTEKDTKMEQSNYGTFVDLSAPGEDILGAGTASNEARIRKTGTSQAAAVVAGAAALIKLQHPEFTPSQIKVALKSSTDPLSIDNPLWLTRLGSGKLNVSEAMQARLLTQPSRERTVEIRPQGFLRYQTSKAFRPVTWEIKHTGNIKGTWLSIEYMNAPAREGILQIFPTDIGIPQADRRQTVRLEDLGSPLWIKGHSPVIMFFPDPSVPSLEWILQYWVEPVYLPTLYCEGIQEHALPGTITDGSGTSLYSPQTDCKWQITAPEGKVIHFHFTSFDTEQDRDSVYFFNGRGTHEKSMAIFSGKDIPPDFTSWGSEALVWFVADSENQAAGWELEFHFIAPPKIKDDLSERDSTENF